MTQKKVSHVDQSLGAGEQAELIPCDAEIERVLGVSLRAVEGMDKSVRQVLGADTNAISTLRCLKLYLERLGCDFQNASELQCIAGRSSVVGLSLFGGMEHLRLGH